MKKHATNMRPIQEHSRAYLWHFEIEYRCNVSYGLMESFPACF